MIKEYITYLKYNPKGYWFKAKLYGWGWTPATWQGWLVILVYVIAITFFALTIDENSPTREIIFTFVLPAVLLTATLFRICYKKGEKPRWQWGPAKGKGGNDKDWSDYYKATKAKPPRPLLVKALEYVPNKNKAIDIGGGALNDTKYLLDQGFDVTVIDKSPLMEEEAKNIPSDKLHAHTTSFEDFDFPKE